MAEHFVDRLLAAIEEKGSPVCVGIDPDAARLPEELRGPDGARAIGEFARAVVEAVAPHVPAVKPQSAHFEHYGGEGVAAYYRLVRQARQLGLIVIGDVKRGDIGSTAKMYAGGHLALPDSPDAITVNGYFGADGLAPFVDAAAAAGKGIFVLVRTSNPSAGAIQDFADAAGTKLYEHVAAQVAKIGAGQGLTGQSGYSCVGAVVGATYPDDARRLRRLMPRQMFLVPGYGAQGATAEACAAAFKGDGTGAIVNASRSVIYAYEKSEYASMDWREAIAAAARAFADDVRQAVTRST